MSFVERMKAGEFIAARYRAGELTRDAAHQELTDAFRGTSITEGGIQSYLNDWMPGPPLPWVVVEVEDHSAGVRVRAYGPHPDRDTAEQARRRIHLDHALTGAATRFWPPKTYTVQVEPEPSHWEAPR